MVNGRFCFNLPDGEQIHRALEGARRMVEIAAQIRHGHLDKTVSLTSASGPVGLGFLDLTVELYAVRNLVTPVRGAFQIRWVMAPTGVTLHVVGDTHVEDMLVHRTLALSTTLHPGNLSPGIVGFSELLTDRPIRVYNRRGKVRYRVSSYGLRVRVMEVARPIGSVPHLNGAAFVPLSA